MARNSIARRGDRYYCLPPFAAGERIQESLRKRIVRDLLCEAVDCEKRAAKARKLARAVASLEALRDRGLLTNLVRFGIGQGWIADLFGVSDLWWKVQQGKVSQPSGRWQWRYTGDHFLFDCVEGRSFLRGSDTAHDEQSSTSESASKDPIAAAAAIVADAQRVAAMDAIDWTQNPKDEQERVLRTAILKAIEKEHFRIWREPNYCWLHDLEELAPHAAEFIGEDLFDEIKRVRKLTDETREARKRADKNKLMKRALGEIDEAHDDAS